MTFSKKVLMICGLWAVLAAHSLVSSAQTIYQYKADSATVCFFDKDQAQYVPHMMRKYQLSRDLHRQIWGNLPSEAPFILLTDWEDDGNAGVSALPSSFIQIGMAPLNKSFFIYPTNERYDYVFKHEYTHVVMADKENKVDGKWRAFTGNKVVPNSDYPLSALWSWLDVPRWYAPRWYHEGIACFLETWLSGGVGRSLGGYDETYFRTRVRDGKNFFSVVGLETEGSTSDFQQGSTSYLYGTRFINYLTLQYGFDKLVEFYNRTDDSKASYTKQFEQVYGKTVRDAWNDWIEYENAHQIENLKEIEEYPLTELRPMMSRNLGSMSPMIVDEENKVAFAAVNYPGDFEKIVKMSIDSTGRLCSDMKRIGYIDGAKTYQPAYIAYDKKGQRLFWTDRNLEYRGLVVYDLRAKRVVKRLKFQRMYDICYDNANDCLYGLLSNEGICHLIKYDSKLEKREVLYSFPFGLSVSDLDVSHDGTRLVAAIQGVRGEHSLIMFNVSDFEEAMLGYETLYTMDDSNLSQFRFSHDDSKLVGFSYYTGVPNIWEYDFATRGINLLSNVQTGIFAPYLGSENQIYALEFSSDGMTPVTFERKVLYDANSVEFLGQKVYDANPEIASLSVNRTLSPELSFGEVYDSVKVYNPLKEIKFQGVYPDISGFVDKLAWNHVVPVIGCHLSFYDPLSLLSVNMFLGASPWSNNPWKNRFHASAEIKYQRWTLESAWNPVCFYDLFGPLRSSRKGYHVVLSYDSKHELQYPFTWAWGGSLAHYGDMDALPLFQEVKADLTSFQTAQLYIKGGKVRGSIGSVEAEQGYRFSASAYSYLAGGRFFPSIDVSGDLGFLLPFGKNNSFWLRGAAGQTFGDSNSTFGNTYFGGFRNNYVDNGIVNRFRSVSAMPGARIDQICANNYVKASGEFDFSPIRFNDFGSMQFYPNYIQFCLFAHDLMTDMWGQRRNFMSNYVSTGAQMNVQLVIFTHMKATLSFGYGRVWGPGMKQGEFMASLKLL